MLGRRSNESRNGGDEAEGRERRDEMRETRRTNYRGREEPKEIDEGEWERRRGRGGRGEDQ